MNVLLTIATGRLHGDAMRWQVHLYDLGNFFETVIRYFLHERTPSLATDSLPVRAAPASLRRPVVSPTRRSHRDSPSYRPALRGAVAMTPVTPATQKEELPALRPPTENKSKRFHDLASICIRKVDAAAKS